MTSSIRPSLFLGLLAFGADRAHKFIQISPDCLAPGAAPCVSGFSASSPLTALGWRGGEVLPVTSFFDYVLVWNTGISYGLLASVPVALLALLMAGAILALSVWWLRTGAPLVRMALALAIGGALSNAIDRLLYGAVADFFHFHWDGWSFYIFNIADTAITCGVVLLLLDALGVGRRPPRPAAE